jgi:hypothetical protein
MGYPVLSGILSFIHYYCLIYHIYIFGFRQKILKYIFGFRQIFDFNMFGFRPNISIFVFVFCLKQT